MHCQHRLGSTDEVDFRQGSAKLLVSTGLQLQTNTGMDYSCAVPGCHVVLRRKAGSVDCISTYGVHRNLWAGRTISPPTKGDTQNEKLKQSLDIQEYVRAPRMNP